MFKRLVLAAACICLTGATTAPSVQLWRLDCGTFVTKHLTDSCYLIRHDRQWLLWDAGFGVELIDHPKTMATGSVIELHQTLASQLSVLGLTADRIDIVALSHLHDDHIEQAAAFPKATLLMGKEDWNRLTSGANDPALEPERLKPWVDGAAPKELVTGDKDIFGDGSVVMLAMPGHTAGHHALLVRLKTVGPVLLTGDLYSSAKQYAEKSVPIHNEDAEATKASFIRFDRLAKTLGATVVIQHEPADIGKLPIFPQSAK